MGRWDNKKYDRDKVVELLIELGYERDNNSRGKNKGKGDHIAYVSKDFEDIVITVPAQSAIAENMMVNICQDIALGFIVTGQDLPNNKRKDKYFEKLQRAMQRGLEDVRSLFSTHTRRCLGIRDDADIYRYVETRRAKYKQNQGE